MSVEGGSIGGGIGGAGGIGGGISGGVGVASIGGGISGIESGGVAGAASVSGAAILGMPSLEAAPVVVNAGLVRSLEGFRPMNASDINTIDFKGGTVAPSQPSVIAQAEEVAGAAWEAPQLNATDAVIEPNVMLEGAKRPIASIQKDSIAAPAYGVAMLQNDREMVVPQIEPWVLPLTEPAPALQVSPALEPVAKTRVSRQVAPVISPQPLLQEQIVEEEVVEKAGQAEPENSLEEEEEIEKRLFLEDEKALAVRKFEIRQAVKLAFASVKDARLSTIVGSLVARFLPGEHAGNRSQALKEKGPDGSYEETVEAIASSGEFNSPEQAEKRFDEIVAEKKPVKNSKEGSPVADSDVARVFKHRVVKPPAAVEIYSKRVVKKQVQVPVGQAAAPKTETSLADYPELEGVFEKAA